ncbi:MAG TPA: alkaline phosphatase family protein [Candidatus Polarisedimenticolaceae bacterium]|nr:alkaline phosphatase family protein [Candidatus Polarisedimenticolaceae bacterium]
MIGIDALDPDLLERWRDRLPHFSAMMEKGRYGRLESTFPPDSIPAWTSIYTGLDPSAHGGLEYIDYLDIKSGARLDVSRVRGKAFWDVAGHQGKRVLVVNPFMAYPAWPVNGTMISGPVFVTGEVSVEPPSFALPGPLPELGGMVEFPTARTLRSFYDRCTRVTEGQTEFFATLLKRERWDLAYVLFLTLDRVKHFYWRFEDREHPCHAEWGDEAHPIRTFYQLLDGAVGRLQEALPPGATLLILSDHGHQRRCTRLFYVNEWLRRRGLLEAPGGGAGLLSPRVLLERSKNMALGLAFHLRAEDTLSRLARHVPNRKALKRSDHVVRAQTSMARASSFAGVNPFGGIVLYPEACRRRGRTPGEVGAEILAGLRQVKDARGEPVVRWVRPREEVVPAGANAERYPDLLFELDPSYGVSWSLYHSLFGPNLTMRKISGGHTRHGAVLSAGPRAAAVPPHGLRVTDISRLITAHFGIPPS